MSAPRPASPGVLETDRGRGAELAGSADERDAAERRSAQRDLAERARAGDRQAFARLYERYAAVVHGVLLARVPPGDAADLVQDVFLTALGAIGSLQQPDRVGPWLCAIARNRALDAQRSRRESVELPDELPDPSPPGDPGDADEAARALAAVRSLPEAYRETLILRLVEGLSGPEIAARTGLTPGSVRVNLCRGMKLLREALGEGAAP